MEELEAFAGGEPDVDALTDEDDEVPIPPPEPRPRVQPIAHRQPAPLKVETATGTSSWVGRPREGFTSAMEERLPEMRKGKGHSLVKGVSHLRDVQDPRPRKES